MTNLLLITFFLCFSFLTWYRFHWGLYLLFLLLPTYLIRFKIGLLPTNMLEVILGIITVAWILNYRNTIISKVRKLTQTYPYLFIGYGVFILAATISIFSSTNIISAAGKWKAFYAEPFILFLILTTSIEKKEQLNNILLALIGSGIATGILAIYQQFTGWMVPYSFWENNQSYRVTGWYGFPNGVGHFLAPMVPVAIYLVKDKWAKISNQKENILEWSKFLLGSLMIPLAILGSIFAKSSAALIGIIAAIGIILLYHKKIRWWIIGIGTAAFIGLLILPSNNPIKQELLMQNRSGQIRINMWQETIGFISDKPLLGAGIGDYKNEIIPYRTTAKIEVFHHPHNLFLTMWVNLGILGLIGFVWLIVWFYKTTIFDTNYKNKQEKNKAILACSTMTVFLVMGLVDSPYIKNDLALFFWLPIAITILKKHLSTSESLPSVKSSLQQ